VRKTGILYLGVLAILALLSRGLLLTVQSSLQADNHHPDQFPLLIIDDFLATRMNAQGERAYTLSAPHMVQLPNPQGSWLEQPVVVIFQDQVSTWWVRADRGWVSPGNELIRLEGGVSLTRPASSDKQPVVITTPKVWLRPAESYAETAETVRAETPNGMLTGVGARAYLREQQVELLSAVRGHYVSPPKP
jgi:lipopolysaccharide export system protein LptC